LVAARAWLAAGASASLLAQAGSISGELAYPGEEIPALVVVAADKASGRQFSVRTAANQKTYRIEIPAGVRGSFLVFAMPVEDIPQPWGQPPLRGAYTFASRCAVATPEKNLAGGCKDHRVLAVEASGDAELTRIAIDDWYLDAREIERLPALLPAGGTGPAKRP